MLRGMLDVLPDNKIVEDMHNTIRADKSKRRSDRRSILRVLDVTFGTTALELRGTRHPARVSKDDVVKRFKATKTKKDRLRNWSSRHKLAQAQGLIMGKKTWGTVSETSLRKSAAAWHWLQVGSLGFNLALDSALSSKLVKSDTVLLKDGQECVACLGHATWAFLAWPVDVLQVDEAGLRTMKLRFGVRRPCKRPILKPP